MGWNRVHGGRARPGVAGRWRSVGWHECRRAQQCWNGAPDGRQCPQSSSQGGRPGKRGDGRARGGEACVPPRVRVCEAAPGAGNAARASLRRRAWGRRSIVAGGQFIASVSWPVPRRAQGGTRDTGRSQGANGAGRVSGKDPGINRGGEFCNATGSSPCCGGGRGAPRWARRHQPLHWGRVFEAGIEAKRKGLGGRGRRGPRAGIRQRVVKGWVCRACNRASIAMPACVRGCSGRRGARQTLAGYKGRRWQRGRGAGEGTRVQTSPGFSHAWGQRTTAPRAHK